MIPDIINKNFTEDILNVSAIIFAGIIVIFFIIASWIFIHHWKSYGITEQQTRKLFWIYFSFSTFLLFIMGISLILLFLK